MGYVGLPIVVAFAEKVNVIGFDINSKKIDLYKRGCDPTYELGDEVVKASNIFFTSDEKDLSKAKFIIVAVPTPVNSKHIPDLTPVGSEDELMNASISGFDIEFEAEYDEG